MATIRHLHRHNPCPDEPCHSGKSLGRYVYEQQLEATKALLAKGQRVKAVAYAMGFASPSAFCHPSKQATGMSPGAYQERKVH
jgi:AraC family transcriptional regulator